MVVMQELAVDAMFGDAVSHAEKGLSVLFLVLNSAVHRSLLNIDTVATDIAARIHFKSFDDASSLRKYLCYAHMVMEKPPQYQRIYAAVDGMERVCYALLHNMLERPAAESTSADPPVVVVAPPFPAVSAETGLAAIRPPFLP